MKKQCQDLLAYLQEHGSITPLDALHKLGCMRLGARIWDLRHEGYNIDSAICCGTGADGRKVHYSRYTLKGPEDNA